MNHTILLNMCQATGIILNPGEYESTMRAMKIFPFFGDMPKMDVSDPQG